MLPWAEHPPASVNLHQSALGVIEQGGLTVMAAAGPSTRQVIR
jgi:hypothetical protein